MNTDKKRYTFYLDAPLVDDFRSAMERKGMPMSEMLNRLIRAYLTQKEAPKQEPAHVAE